MSVKRNFVNVGQALFAIEERNGKTIVYDCGGEAPQVIPAVLPYVLKENSVIDILFISHYDKDHINGIQHLLMHCSVRHIVLPMLEHACRFIPLLNMPYYSFEYKFTINPQMAIQDTFEFLRSPLGRHDGEYRDREFIEPQIHYVEKSDEGDNDVNLERPVLIDDLRKGQTISSRGAIRIDSLDDWVYLPYNRRLMTQNEEREFFDILGVPYGCSDDESLYHWQHNWPNAKLGMPFGHHNYYNRNLIKEAWYIATHISLKEINDFSMTLYSGHAYINAKEGCLYTGDYNAKKHMNELIRYYNPIWNKICVVQVPHHGSRNNFDNRLIIPSATHVISNKEFPYRSSDVKYQNVWDEIRHSGEEVVGTWQEPLC